MMMMMMMMMIIRLDGGQRLIMMMMIRQDGKQRLNSFYFRTFGLSQIPFILIALIHAGVSGTHLA